MFDRIIVATDFSLSAYEVVRCLGGLKAYGAKECLLMQCLSLQQVGSIALSYTTSILESNLQSQREIIEKQGLKVETRIVPGMPKKEICRIAEKENYSIIVVGAEKHSLTSEAFLGGLAYDVIHNCRKPVLIIRLEDTQSEGITCIQAKGCNFSQHILFPTDFSETADLAFGYVKELVKDGARKITLMHIQDQTRIDPHLLHRLDEFNQTDTARLEAMKKEIMAIADIEVELALTYGKPSIKILEKIHEQDVQLVVMGSQGRGYVKELFLGSVSHEITRHSDASVLLIPAKYEPETSETI